MAGELHDHIRSDAVGESEADEGLAAGVGANLGPFGEDVIVPYSVAVEGDLDGRIEFADLAEVFEAAVHLLVGHVWKSPSAGEILVFVFVQDGDGILMEDDRQAVVGLPSTTNYTDNQLVTNLRTTFTHNERKVVRILNA